MIKFDEPCRCVKGHLYGSTEYTFVNWLEDIYDVWKKNKAYA